MEDFSEFNFTNISPLYLFIYFCFVLHIKRKAEKEQLR